MHANANANNQAHQHQGGQQQPAPPAAGQHGFIGPLPQGQPHPLPLLPPNAGPPQGPPIPGVILQHQQILQQVTNVLAALQQNQPQPPPVDPNEPDYRKRPDYVMNQKERFVKEHELKEKEPDADYLQVLLLFLSMFGEIARITIEGGDKKRDNSQPYYTEARTNRVSQIRPRIKKTLPEGITSVTADAAQ